jgi:hypothetical protein
MKIVACELPTRSLEYQLSYDLDMEVEVRERLLRCMQWGRRRRTTPLQPEDCRIGRVGASHCWPARHAPLRTGRASWPRIRLKHGISASFKEPAPGYRWRTDVRSRRGKDVGMTSAVVSS